MMERKSDHHRFYQIVYVFFLALFAFPVYPLLVTNILFMLVCLLSIIAFLLKPFPLSRLIKQNILFVIPFLPYIIELFISGFDPIARFELQKKLLLITAPLLLPVFIWATGYRSVKPPLLVFSLSVGALTLITFVSLGLQGILTDATSFSDGAFLLRSAFEDLTGLHPTYYSLFALFSGAFLASLIEKSSRVIKLLLIFCIILLLGMVLIIAAKIAVIGSIILIIAWFVRSSIKSKYKLFAAMAVLVFFVLIIFAFPSVKNRFTELVRSKSGETIQQNSFQERLSIFNCSFVVFSDNIFVGTGSRHFQEKMNDCYKNEGCATCEERSYNPHNQFFSMGINFGIAGLLVFLTCLFIIFRKLIRSSDGLCFTILILLFFMTESLLERQMGTYFFVLTGLVLLNQSEALNKEEKKL